MSSSCTTEHVEPTAPSLLPRYRLLPLAHDTVLARADHMLDTLRGVPGVLKTALLPRNHSLIIQYDLGCVCLAFLECWLEDNGVRLYNGYYMEPMHVAIHHAERHERRMLLGTLVEQIPCGSPHAHVRLASVARELPAAKDRHCTVAASSDCRPPH